MARITKSAFRGIEHLAGKAAKAGDLKGPVTASLEDRQVLEDS